MTPAEIIARVTRALEALRDGEVGLAEHILDDLLSEYWMAQRPQRRPDDSGERWH